MAKNFEHGEKNIMRKIVIALCLVLSQMATADEYAGKVKNFYINNSGLVLLKIENSSGETPAECPGGHWPFRFSLSDTGSKEWISMLLTAKATDDYIRAGYQRYSSSGHCKVKYLYFRG